MVMWCERDRRATSWLRMCVLPAGIPPLPRSPCLHPQVELAGLAADEHRLLGVLERAVVAGEVEDEKAQREARQPRVLVPQHVEQQWVELGFHPIEAQVGAPCPSGPHVRRGVAPERLCYNCQPVRLCNALTRIFALRRSANLATAGDLARGAN